MDRDYAILGYHHAPVPQGPDSYPGGGQATAGHWPGTLACRRKAALGEGAASRPRPNGLPSRGNFSLPPLLMGALRFSSPKDSHAVICPVCPDTIQRRLRTRMPLSTEHVRPGVSNVQTAGMVFCQEKHFRACSMAPESPGRERRMSPSTLRARSVPTLPHKQELKYTHTLCHIDTSVTLDLPQHACWWPVPTLPTLPRTDYTNRAQAPGMPAPDPCPVLQSVGGGQGLEIIQEPPAPSSQRSTRNGIPSVFPRKNCLQTTPLPVTCRDANRGAGRTAAKKPGLPVKCSWL